MKNTVHVGTSFFIQHEHFHNLILRLLNLFINVVSNTATDMFLVNARDKILWFYPRLLYSFSCVWSTIYAISVSAIL